MPISTNPRQIQKLIMYGAWGQESVILSSQTRASASASLVVQAARKLV
jgi:hypothetical protein